MKIGSIGYSQINQTNNKTQNNPAFKGQAWVETYTKTADVHLGTISKIVMPVLEGMLTEAGILFTKEGQVLVVPTAVNDEAARVVDRANLLNPNKRLFNIRFN